jgi:hypothetical protein
VSSTDVLLNVATAARLFHASDGTGFADLIIDGHRETWPLRSRRFRAWLRQQYYERAWDAPSPAAFTSMCWRRRPSSMLCSATSRSASPSRTAGSTSIWRMSSGAASKSAPTDGGSPRILPSVVHEATRRGHRGRHRRLLPRTNRKDQVCIPVLVSGQPQMPM